MPTEAQVAEIAGKHPPMPAGSCGFNKFCTCKGGCFCQQCWTARLEANHLLEREGGQ